MDLPAQFLIWLEGYEDPLVEDKKIGVRISWIDVLIAIDLDIEDMPRIIEIYDEKRLLHRGTVRGVLLSEDQFMVESDDLFIEPIEIAQASTPLLFNEGHVFFTYRERGYVFYPVFDDDDTDCAPILF